MSELEIDPYEVRRSAKSTLAFALNCLSKQRCDDMTTFYAFCRVVDDIADSELISVEKKRADLTFWKEGLLNDEFGNNTFGQTLLDVCDRYDVDKRLLVAIVDGCLDDLTPVSFQTWEDLKGYTWKVACAVGLVSIKIFGCENAQSEDYAVKLGHALQLTNIIRDVGHDLELEGRIYLPLEEMEPFGYSEEKLKKRVYDDTFVKMMQYQAKRAKQLFEEARQAMPIEDKKALHAARIMGSMYQTLLEKVERNNFNVFDQVHKLSFFQKVKVLTKSYF